MSELRTLYRHASHYLTGRVAAMLLGFISFPVIARIFSVADYGTISLTLKIIVLFTVLGKFGVQNSVQRFYAEEVRNEDTEQRRSFYSTMLFAVMVMAGVIGLAFAGVLGVIPVTWISPNLRHALLLASVLILIRALQPTLLSFLRAAGRTKSYNAIEVGTKAITVALVLFILLTISRTVSAFLTGTIMGESLAILVFFAFLYRAKLLSFRTVDWALVKKALVFGFPLIGYELATVVLDSGDRIIVQFFLGAQAVGHYSAAYNIATYVEEAVMQPINLALFPIYMKLWVDKGLEETRAFLSRSLHNFLLLAILVVVLVVTTSRDVVVVLASKKFEQAHHLLPLLVIGLLVYAIHIFLNAALLIHQKTKTMMKLVTYACGVNILLNVVLVPRIGTMGAAWATLLSYAFLIIAMGRASFRLIRLDLDWWRICLGALAGTLAGFAAVSIHLQVGLLNIVLRSLVCVVVYAGFLVAADGKCRDAVVSLLHPKTKDNIVLVHE